MGDIEKGVGKRVSGQARGWEVRARVRVLCIRIIDG